MNRTIGLLAILAVIIGTAVFLTTRQSDSNRSFEDYEGNFAVKNVEDVGRIVLQNGRKYKVELKSTADGWWVDGKYRARMGSVEPLLDCHKACRYQVYPA